MNAKHYFAAISYYISSKSDAPNAWDAPTSGAVFTTQGKLNVANAASDEHRKKKPSKEDRKEDPHSFDDWAEEARKINNTVTRLAAELAAFRKYDKAADVKEYDTKAQLLWMGQNPFLEGDFELHGKYNVIPVHRIASRWVPRFVEERAGGHRTIQALTLAPKGHA
jgi:hypothetical protein